MHNMIKNRLPWYERLAIVRDVAAGEVDEGRHSRGRSLKRYAKAIRRRRRKDQRKGRKAHRYG